MRSLLATRWGRLAAFSGLYLCEGLPQGYAAVAVTLELKRAGMEAAAIGTFSAFIMLPWAWKWVMGPIVENLRLARFGRRSQWIIACQALMILAVPVSLALFPHRGDDGDWVGLALFSGVLLLLNVFSASQDVAIDALAVDTLDESETGLANGLMFASAQVGMTIGGSGVLFLKKYVGFTTASLIVPMCLLAILVLIVTSLGEPKAGPWAAAAKAGESAVARVARALRDYIVTVARVFLTTRNGLLGMILALLPFGGMALSLTVSTIITPTLGMTDDEIGTLNVASSVVFTICCMTGGWLSDLFGRRRMVALFSLLTLVPTLWMGWQLKQAGWDLPVEAAADGTWPRHEALIVAWWVASMAYALFLGLQYGIRTALFMDLSDRRIAATQFTAFMALTNAVTIYSYWWEGQALTSVAKGGWGFTYWEVMLADCVLGALFVFLLPAVRPGHTHEAVHPDPA